MLQSNTRQYKAIKTRSMQQRWTILKRKQHYELKISQTRHVIMKQDLSMEHVVSEEEDGESDSIC